MRRKGRVTEWGGSDTYLISSIFKEIALNSCQQFSTKPHTCCCRKEKESSDLCCLTLFFTLLCALQEEGVGSGGGDAERGGGFWQHVEAGLREQAERLRSDLALCRQENRELQERLMVSEATVHAQADQLKDYRELLSE